MKILLASGNAPWPFCRGGAEVGAHALLDWLHRRGHSVKCIGSAHTFLYTHDGTFADLGHALRDHRIPFRWYERTQTLESPDGSQWPASCSRAYSYNLGYDVVLAEREHDAVVALLEALARDRPDVVITYLARAHDVARAAIDKDIPAVLIQPSLDITATHPHSLQALAESGAALAAVVAPSRFIECELASLFSVRARVIPPVIDERLFEDLSSPENVRARPLITQVNAQPVKGFGMFLRVARILEGEHFLAVESWFPSPWQLREVVSMHPNVELAPHTGTDRLVDHYRRTRLLMVPSVCPEAFGRVVIEAQHGGIPVLASAVGGLPEAVGDGGILLSPDASATEWAEAARVIINDPERFGSISRCARANAAHFRMNECAGMFETLLVEISR